MNAAELSTRFRQVTQSKSQRKAGEGTYAHAIERASGRIPAPGTFIAWCNEAEVEHYFTDPSRTERLLDIVVDCPGTSQIFGSQARVTLRARADLIVASAIALSSRGASATSRGFQVALVRLQDAIAMLVLTPGSVQEIAQILGIEAADIDALPARTVHTAVPS
jgi:hypothetical protein